MKKLLLIFAAAIVCVSGTAQNAKIARIGATTTSGGEILQPRTTLYVDIDVVRQDIIAGPYARYAQKYLGVAAPLTDKVIHEIKSAKISDNSELQKQIELTKTAPVSHMSPGSGFPKLPIDKTSGTTAQNPEESARLAAGKIFEIRRSRYELVTGEAGENVFGAGLASALAELDRLEEEYLSLFLGKQTYLTVTRQYPVTPAQGTLNYTVCRFSDTDGLLPDDDLSGRPLVLELKPLPATVSTEGFDIQAKPTSKTAAYRIAADVTCRIIFDNTELTSTVIPVYQFGKTIHITQ